MACLGVLKDVWESDFPVDFEARAYSGDNVSRTMGASEDFAPYLRES